MPRDENRAPLDFTPAPALEPRVAWIEKRLDNHADAEGKAFEAVAAEIRKQMKVVGLVAGLIVAWLVFLTIRG